MEDDSELPEIDILSDEGLLMVNEFLNDVNNSLESSSLAIEEKIELLERVKGFLVPNFIKILQHSKVSNDRLKMVSEKVHKPLTVIILKVEDLEDSIRENQKIPEEKRKEYISQIAKLMIVITEASSIVQYFIPLDDQDS